MDGNSLMFRLLVGEEKTHCSKKWTFFRSGDLFFATDSMIGGVKMNAGRRGKSLARFFYVWISAIVLVSFSINIGEAEETPTGSISGKITSVSGAGIAGVTAQAFKEGVHEANSAATTGDGKYTISNLEGGGSYTVHFFAFDTEYLSRWYSDSDPNGAEEVNATSFTVSGDATDKDIILPLGGTISGQLVNDTGCDSGIVEGIWVQAFDSNEDFRGYALTSETGAFTIGGLPLGENMRLEIWDYNGAGVKEWYEDVASFADATPVNVPSTGGITVNFCSLKPTVNLAPVYLLLL